MRDTYLVRLPDGEYACGIVAPMSGGLRFKPRNSSHGVESRMIEKSAIVGVLAETENNKGGI
jgi:hypothetical protein